MIFHIYRKNKKVQPIMKTTVPAMVDLRVVVRMARTCYPTKKWDNLVSKKKSSCSLLNAVMSLLPEGMLNKFIPY